MTANVIVDDVYSPLAVIGIFYEANVEMGGFNYLVLA